MKESARLGALVVLLAVGYYFAARLGLGFRFQSSQIGVVWPANGLFLSALLLTRRNRWWIVLGIVALTHMFVMLGVVPAWRWSWQIVGNAAFVMTTAAVLKRFAGLPLHFADRRQVIAYTVIAFAMPFLYGFTTPAFVRSLLGLEQFTPAAALQRTMMSNATALLLVAPVILLVAQHGIRALEGMTARRLLEGALMLTTLLAVGVIAFGTGPEIAGFPSLLLWTVPPLLWAAVRFGPLGANAALFCVGALTVWGTARELGPFVLVGRAEQVLSLQMFWIVLTTPVMLLAAVIREGQQVEDKLHEQRNQLAHVTRLATVGELSGALAHELRQPLTSILASAEAGAQFLAAKPPDLREVRQILNDIAEQDRHAASVISRVRSFLREGDSHFDVVDIETVVRDALALARRTIANGEVDVQTFVAGAPTRVHGDRVQLLQVLLNLIVNACEAMSAKPASDRRLIMKVSAVEEANVEILVSDTGGGLPAEKENQPFEPFFTTKEKGLGLGLVIGQSIAQAHGGRLWGENNSQGGATFHLLLPRARSLQPH